MEKIRKKYYITTAIAYTSGKPHIGNTYEARSGGTVSPAFTGSRGMTYSFRQEQMSTDRRSS